jgi:alpha-N-arabinofuranosidase
MTGMERNSDIVIMESYAPLFVNVNPGGMQWESDLIGYDALSSYGSPSYWAQVIFASHSGTEVVNATLTNAGSRVATSVTRDEQQRKIFIKLVNGTSGVQHFDISLDGVSSVKRDATLITMSGKSPNATNTIAHPDNIKPVEHRLTLAGPKFQHSFEPYSINVIEVSY